MIYLEAWNILFYFIQIFLSIATAYFNRQMKRINRIKQTMSNCNDVWEYNFFQNIAEKEIFSNFNKVWKYGLPENMYFCRQTKFIDTTKQIISICNKVRKYDLFKKIKYLILSFFYSSIRTTHFFRQTKLAYLTKKTIHNCVECLE